MSKLLGCLAALMPMTGCASAPPVAAGPSYRDPGRRGPDARKDGPRQRRSLVQVSEQVEQGGIMRTDRDATVAARLAPPG